MSYIKRVLADRPLGFWNLDTTTDLAGNNNLTFNGDHDFTDILPLNTSTYKNSNNTGYTVVNGAKITSSSSISIPGQQKYHAFTSGAEKLTFGMEFWFSLPPDSTYFGFQTLLTIENVGQIFRSGDLIIFYIAGAGFVKKQIKSLKSQNHIFAYYSNRTMGIFVNGVQGESLTLPQNFVFTHTYNQVSFTIPGNYIEGDYIIYNSLAFYDKVLNEKELKSHIMWGLNDSKPQSYVKKISASGFDIQNTKDRTWFQQSFDTEKNWNSGVLNNVIVDNNGLTLKKTSAISDHTFNGLLDFISLNNFSLEFSMGNYHANAEIIKINVNNSSEYIVIRTTDTDLLYFEYTQNEITSQIIDPIDISGLSFFHVMLSTKNSYVSLAIQDVPSFLEVYTSNSYPIFNPTQSSLIFNNNYINSGINIFNTNVDLSEYYKVEQIGGNYVSTGRSKYNDNFILYLDVSGQIVQTTGIWTYTIPSSLYYKIVGGKISWNSATPDQQVDFTHNLYNNVSVQIDKGNGWEIVNNSFPILNYDFYLYDTNFAGEKPDQAPGFYFENDIKIRVVILSTDASSAYQPRIDNLEISIYKDLSIQDDTSNYVLEPYSIIDENWHNQPPPGVQQISSRPYAIKSNNYNVLSRSNNFGIKTSLECVPFIRQNIPNLGYKSLEFWFRKDTYNSGHIMDTQVTNEYITFNPLISQSGFKKVYVNGEDISIVNKYIVLGESVHIVAIYEDSNINNIYLNNNLDLNQGVSATYGYIALYPNELSSSEVYDRYISFLTNKTEIVNESNSIGTLAEYSGGDAVVAYSSASKQAAI
jgi:hypothetical protein